MERAVCAALNPFLLPELVGVVQGLLFFSFKLLASWKIDDTLGKLLSVVGASSDGKHIVIFNRKFKGTLGYHTVYDVRGNAVSCNLQPVTRSGLDPSECFHQGFRFSVDHGTVRVVRVQTSALECKWNAYLYHNVHFVPQCIAVHPDGTVFLSYYHYTTRRSIVARFTRAGDVLQMRYIDIPVGQMTFLPTGKLVVVHPWMPLIHVYQ